MSIRIVEADLKLPEHREGVLAMVDAYSRDAMGSGKPLDRDVRVRLIPGLQRHPTTLIFLAFEGEQPVGVAVCFIGFSTFAAEPLVNIHDCIVLPAFRGKSVGRRLLEAVEGKARELGCCKLTLEVMDNNDRAFRAYEAAGFVRYALQEKQAQPSFCPNRCIDPMHLDELHRFVCGSSTRGCSRLQPYCCRRYLPGRSRCPVLCQHNGTLVPRIAQRCRSLPCRCTPMSRKPYVISQKRR